VGERRLPLTVRPLGEAVEPAKCTGNSQAEEGVAEGADGSLDAIVVYTYHVTSLVIDHDCDSNGQAGESEHCNSNEDRNVLIRTHSFPTHYAASSTRPLNGRWSESFEGDRAR